MNEKDLFLRCYILKEMEKLHRVLLIDDDETTNLINKRNIKHANLSTHVDAVTSGQEALDYFHRIENITLPLDLILLDIHMPEMNGFEFLEIYKNLPPKYKAKHIFGLTSSASFYDLVKINSYIDITDHIYKPFTTMDYVSLIKKHF